MEIATLVAIFKSFVTVNVKCNGLAKDVGLSKSILDWTWLGKKLSRTPVCPSLLGKPKYRQQTSTRLLDFDN